MDAFEDVEDELIDLDLEFGVFVEEVGEGQELLDKGLQEVFLEEVILTVLKEDLGNSQYEIRIRILSGFLLRTKLHPYTLHLLVLKELN